MGKIDKAVLYLNQHYDRTTFLSDVADLIGLHPQYLCSRFKKEVGVGFHAYLLALRIQRSSRLLVSTDKSIKEISAEAGFGSAEAFSKAFKRVRGCSPRQYRRRLQSCYPEVIPIMDVEVVSPKF